ncbi:hypothetical protein B1759_01910 [Rubrivirga sp. SAORIC476]|uniref:two-component regulator propeller domain-containing protein n=1 Tax=Rubrivirga sp. SAORIC476 TaxID=1961794 RepID=UPI000BA956B1|nr:two-component regulator propeller domain-containing protein [Rubrivirga sp. SAORIC476]PAP80177.1 hypothetical protein B1759_01910 [Rubrivirga sp. SAORIC476]
MILRLPLVLAATLALCLSASAQAPSLNRLDGDRAVTQLAADAWGDAEGLPQSRVEAITQSTDGHLWFGTQEGLARFDGVTFTVLGRGEDELPDADIRALAPGPDGGVWVGTRRGGLVFVDQNLGVRAYGTEAGLPSLAVAALAVAPDGAVWAGTFDGLCRLAPGADRVQCLGVDDGLPTSYVRVLVRGSNGTLWVGTREGLARIVGGRVEDLTRLGGAAAEPIGALAEGSGGTLWVGPLSEEPLALLTRGRLRPRPDVAPGVPIEALYVDTGGALWVGTGGGGLRRVQGQSVETLAEASGADLATVLALLQDREGSLWIGTGGGGLARLRTSKFIPFTTREGLPADRAYTISSDRNRGVWVGTTGGLAHIVGGRVVQTLTAADGLLGDDVSTVYVRENGDVWAGIEGAGLCRIVRGRVERCLTPRSGLPDPYVIALYEYGGTFWVGTATGLSRWDGEALVPLRAPGAPEAAVTALAGGPDGELWIGTYGAGLLRYDGRTVEPVPGTEGDNVLSLHRRRDGALWVGTDGSGLLLLDDGLFRVSTAQGLPSQIVPQILEDEQGRLWLTSNRGVAVASADALAEAARSGAAVQMTRYGRPDGLPSAEANGGSQPAGARATDGVIYVPTNGGVARIDPARIPTNTLPPQAIVEVMLVDGTRLKVGDDPIVLSPGASEFEFRYAGLSYLSPSRVRHRFRLDGRDREWTAAGARRAAYYTDLAPGDYVFRVQAANDDGVWSDTDATVAFTVEPHLWQTGWFLALCVLALLGLAYGATTARTAQLRARAERLEGVVAERTRELADEKAQVERLNGQLSDLNETLQDQVRAQLAEIVRGSRLRKYFPKKVVDRILNQEGDVTVEAERRPVTVVFTDLAGFTKLSEATPPARVTALLNEYLNEMVALIDAHGGTLDKFMGDGIMVLFGAADPMEPDEQARRAVDMAVQMQAAMTRLRAGWRATGLHDDLDLRIGIHQAEVTVGNFGSDELVEFTAIGRGVNLAARLEGACVPGGVLVSREVHDRTASVVAFGPPQTFRLKGIEAPVEAFTVDAPTGGDGVA